MRMLKPREVKKLTYGHTAIVYTVWVHNQSCLTWKLCSFSGGGANLLDPRDPFYVFQIQSYSLFPN